MEDSMARKPSVSMRAIIQRVNRKLIADDEVLKASRTERMRSDCGDYYIVDWRHNSICQMHVDPVALARELGVLHRWEAVQ
jgi:hypothetical protein